MLKCFEILKWGYGVKELRILILEKKLKEYIKELLDVLIVFFEGGIKFDLVDVDVGDRGGYVFV